MIWLSLQLAWRNLWRNPQRTWLTVSSVAFAVWLISFTLCIATGTYESAQKAGTGLFTGDIQIQAESYWEDQDIVDVIDDVAAHLEGARSLPGVAQATPRLIAMALASNGERSFGVQLVGIDSEFDQQVARLTGPPAIGRTFNSSSVDEAMVGAVLARNLGLELGAEMSVLSTGREGGVAAMALTVVGIFDSGTPALDRSLVFVPISSVAAAFDFKDQAHQLVFSLAEGADDGEVINQLKKTFPTPLEVRGWEQLIPDLANAINLEKMSTWLIFGLLIAILSLCLINAFIMIQFERTREFGVLKAIGLKPNQLIGMLQLEALCIWILGSAIGISLTLLIVLGIGPDGFVLSESISEVTSEIYGVNRIQPVLSMGYLCIAPLFLFFGIQMAAFIPGIRLWKLSPNQAIRTGH